MTYYISWEAVTELNIDDVTESEVFGLDVHLLSVANAECELGNQFLEGLHDFGGFVLLVVCKQAGSNADKVQHEAEIEVIAQWLFFSPELQAKKILNIINKLHNIGHVEL